MVKSRILRWYERHEETVKAVVGIACDAFPGGSLVKGVLDVGIGIHADQEEGKEKKRIEHLENFLSEIKPKIYDFIEEVEELKEFKNAMTEKERREIIYGNIEVTQELHKVIPEISPIITSSVQYLSSQGEKNTYNKICEGKYILERCLASGGQGVVYQGRNMVAETEVAIKFLPEELSCNPDAVKMFKKEYQRLGKLVHTNIVQYRDIDFAQEKNQWFVSMDYIQGSTLRKVMYDQHGEPLEKERVVELLDPVAKALAFAHQQGIIHCDIKPENILIRNDGKVFLTDFGLSQELQQSILKSTGEEMNIQGTLPYMSPEQYKGWKVNNKTDVWSLGVIMYEMLAGHHPFNGRSYSHYKDIICNEEAQPLANEELWGIMRYALAKKTDDRMDSVVDLIKELKQTGTTRVANEHVAGTRKEVQKEVQNDMSFISFLAKKISSEDDEQNEQEIEAFNGYKLAADKGESMGMYHIGCCYYYGKGVKKDREKALEWLEKAAGTNNLNAIKELGKIYKEGKYIETSYGDAINWYKKAAECGELDAIKEIALMYEKGSYNFEDNELLALEWYKKAAEYGDIDAMKWVAQIYQLGGSIVESDDHLYVRWKEKIGNTGDIEAIRELVEIYEEGLYGTKNNGEKCVEWMKKVAEAGDIEIMARIAQIYEYGEYGIKIDHDVAVQWYEKAAKKGCMFAVQNLFKMSEEGKYKPGRSGKEAILDLYKNLKTENNINSEFDW